MKVNFIGKCIEVTNAEMKRAQNAGSQEYVKLIHTMKELPEFQIVLKQSTRKAYNTHAGLTCEFMEDVVKAIAPERIPEFQAIRVTYRSYSAVKRWFLEAFPEVYENLWFAA